MVGEKGRRPDTACPHYLVGQPFCPPDHCLMPGHPGRHPVLSSQVSSVDSCPLWPVEGPRGAPASVDASQEQLKPCSLVMPNTHTFLKTCMKPSRVGSVMGRQLSISRPPHPRRAPSTPLIPIQTPHAPQPKLVPRDGCKGLFSSVPSTWGFLIPPGSPL